MSEDRIRTLFRQADASLGYAPPDLDSTIRQAKRETAMRRGRWTLGSAALVMIAAVAGWAALRPDVERVTPAGPAPTVAPVKPCGEIPDAKPGSITTQQAQAFVDDFMKRRIAGSGAEACLSSVAVDAYRAQQTDTYDPNTSMCLYGCGEFKVVEYDVASPVAQADANSFEAQLFVLANNGQETVRWVERLAIGPGATSTGEQQALVIRGAGTA